MLTSFLVKGISTKKLLRFCFFRGSFACLAISAQGLGVLAGFWQAGDGQK